MYALKEPPMKTLFGSTDCASTIPDCLAQKPFPSIGLGLNNTSSELLIPKTLEDALDALAHPEKPFSANNMRTQKSCIDPLVEDGHMILSESFNSRPDKSTNIWNSRIIKRLANTYLVDVQRIWEGYDGQWIQEGPLLLRFETIDIVLSPLPSSNEIVVWTGYLDTSLPVYAQRNSTQEGKEINEQTCLQWLTYRNNQHLIGKRVNNAHLFSLIQGSGLASENALAETIQSNALFSLTLEGGDTYTFINKQGCLVVYSN